MAAEVPARSRTSLLSHAIRFTAKDMVEAYRFLEFALVYQVGLEP